MNVLPVSARSRSVSLVVALLAALALLAAWLVLPTVSASAQAPPTVPPIGQVMTQVDICHSASSRSNPYILSTTVNVSSIVPAPTGHTSAPDNTVGVFPAAAWGDIIPPFTWSGGYFAGQNWTPLGQIIFSNSCDIVKVTPAAATAVFASCTNGLANSYTIPSTPVGAEYFVNGSAVATAPGTYTPTVPSTVTITASPASGAYVFTANATTSWGPFAFSNLNCPTSITPAAATAVFASCTNGLANSYTIPSTPVGAEYFVNGSAVATAPGTYTPTVPSTVTITASPASGAYVFTANATTSWGPFAFSNLNCPTSITPAAATAVFASCTNGLANSYTIPSTPVGAEYFVNGSAVATAPGTYTPTVPSTVTITASPASGAYVFTANATTSWGPFAFSNLNCPTSITPAAATAVFASCTNGLANSYTIPSTPVGAEYFVNGSAVATAPGTYTPTVPSTVTITASPASGAYVFTANATTSWGPFAFSNLNCPTSITPATATAVQATCATGASYALTPTVGVIYKVGATVIHNGDAATVPSTPTVTAVSADPALYTLTGTTSWPLLFTVPTGCEDPTATVVKTNDADGDNVFHTDEVAPVVGQPVKFRLRVTNTSPYAINVVSISDAVILGTGEITQETPTLPFGCLEAITNLAPNATADCIFIADSYSAADGQTKTDVATIGMTKYVARVAALRRVAALVAVAPSFPATSNRSTVVTHVALTRATAVPPSVTLSSCVAGAVTAPSFTVPTTTGVVYSPAVGGPGVAGTSTTVTATAAPGYVLSNPGASFPVNFGAAATCPAPPLVILPGNPPVVVPPVTPPAPDEDLGISKTGPGSAQPGDELVYTISVSNVKGTPATGFTVTDVVPTGLAISSAGGSGYGCSIAGQTITCTYGGTLSVGQSAGIEVRGLLDSTYTPDTVVNTAVVDPGRADVDPADNTSTATTTIAPLVVPVAGGGGGEAGAPKPAPKPVAGEGGGAASAPAKGAAIPFTGAYTQRYFQAGVSLLLIGLFLSLAARRRRATAE